MVRILLSNDDGITSPGLRALHEAVRPLGEVTVVAPDREQSAAGHSLSLHRPLRIERVEEGWHAVDGTPTDCVNLALNGLLKDRRPEIVLSGINRGANLGDDITYSGTVAAAMEATLLGLPAVAFSVPYEPGQPMRYGLAIAFARKLTAEVLRRGLKPGVLLNVNVPNLPEEECAGVRLTRQGKRIYGDAIVEKIDPRGREYYWIGGNGLSWVEERGTDFDAVAHRAISVTPIRLDLTDFDALRELERWDFR
ncbi:MAG: 5'/3'-nucleotidase SurE [Candidatus Tectomicrobia bacterium RIFCSPLOWO2_12_FULL_69_37]|nr:MAG: 5'/3'-nucleotidase SurE [Candidatus Tectomicrobia bacterium RIFCSPLOWO2_02_FULL_70_19]OGL63802.1 MAG: 5'/3'-nucleotidase SurE [Candidatus Tectomicrobia bacterium RIFCSPLOWO2_12_FULL_69_37]